MNLDTIKIKMTLEDLVFDGRKFYKRFDELKGWDFNLREGCLGLNGIIIYPDSNTVIVRLSAKILKEQYLLGINLNTIERVWEEVNKFIKCSKDDISNASVLAVDITENLYFDSVQEKEDAVRCLKLGKSNAGYEYSDFTDKGDGITFSKLVKTYKERQIYYNKENDLLRACNKEMMGILLRNNVKDIDKILRVENNKVQKKRMRRAFKQRNKGEIILIDVLNSKEKPLHETHKDIMKFASEITLFDNYTDYNTALKHKGWEGMLSDCKGNIDLVLDFVKGVSSDRAYYRRKGEIEKWFAWFLIKDENKAEKYIKTLEQIGYMLYAA